MRDLDARIAAAAAKAEKLQIKLAQARATAQQLEKRLSAESRKLDTRKKILIGAVMLAEARGNQELSSFLAEIIHERVKRPADRRVFGLDPLPASNAGDYTD